MTRNTVDRYLDLLEKAHVVYSRHGFSRNLRKEVTKSRRYYFYDNGLRNGLISNFNPLSLREDTDALWENYVLAERLKRNLYTGRLAESRFWRTYDQQEIDLVEEWGGRLEAAEMKWSTRAGVRAPRRLAQSLSRRLLPGGPPGELPRLHHRLSRAQSLAQKPQSRTSPSE